MAISQSNSFLQILVVYFYTFKINKRKSSLQKKAKKKKTNKTKKKKKTPKNNKQTNIHSNICKQGQNLFQMKKAPPFPPGDRLCKFFIELCGTDPSRIRIVSYVRIISRNISWLE